MAGRCYEPRTILPLFFQKSWNYRHRKKFGGTSAVIRCLSLRQEEGGKSHCNIPFMAVGGWGAKNRAGTIPTRSIEGSISSHTPYGDGGSKSGRWTLCRNHPPCFFVICQCENSWCSATLSLTYRKAEKMKGNLHIYLLSSFGLCYRCW